jgi:ribonuclease P protein component
MLGRLVHRADFERLLGSPPVSRSAHFALHHMAAGLPPPVRRARQPGGAELSTTSTLAGPDPVDKSPGSDPARGALGFVVPKRHARRAVTRNLLRRLARAVLGHPTEGLPGGQWLLRLRAPLAPPAFVSARSELLAQLMLSELRALRGAALLRLHRAEGESR